MGSRAEITKKYARGYAAASKKDRGRLLDEVVAVTGWSRDNARRRLSRAAVPAKRSTVRRIDGRKQRPRKFSYDAIKVLQRVWAASGGQCGKYLAMSMPHLLDALEAHSELVHGQDRYSAEVRAELIAMSAATIDRYLAPVKARDPIRGVSTTRGSSLLRSSIEVRKAGDEVADEPGLFEGDTVAHCGPTLKGEFARTVNLTDLVTGWVFTRSIRNNAAKWIVEALDAAVEQVPFAISGVDFDNGSEFINHDVINWAADKTIYFTRSRPYTKNDQATIESKNGHLVRRYGYYYRYDTAAELAVLNRLWPLVNDRFNYFTPTKKPAGWGKDRHGKRRRLYDDPATPYARLLATGVLSPAQQRELAKHKATLNPAKLARKIDDCQRLLIKLAADKTDQLRITNTPTELPDTSRGIKLRKAS